MVPSPSCLLKASPSLLRAVRNGPESLAQSLFFHPQARKGEGCLASSQFWGASALVWKLRSHTLPIMGFSSVRPVGYCSSHTLCLGRVLCMLTGPVHSQFPVLSARSPTGGEKDNTACLLSNTHHRDDRALSSTGFRCDRKRSWAEGSRLLVHTPE